MNDFILLYAVLGFPCALVIYVALNERRRRIKGRTYNPNRSVYNPYDPTRHVGQNRTGRVCGSCGTTTYGLSERCGSCGSLNVRGAL